MPHADEALKALFERFKAAPESPVFKELANALLSRGQLTADEARPAYGAPSQLTSSASDDSPVARNTRAASRCAGAVSN